MNNEKKVINYYRVLNVNENATKDELLAAYRMMILKVRATHDEDSVWYGEALKSIEEAKKVLIDSEVSRKIYDDYALPLIYKLEKETKAKVIASEIRKNVNGKKDNSIAATTTRKPIEKQYVRVENTEEAPKQTTKKGKNYIKYLALAVVAALIMVAAGSCTKSLLDKKNKELGETDSSSSSSVTEEVIEPTQTPAPTAEPDFINDATVLEEQSADIWNAILEERKTNPNYAPSITSQDYITEMIKWARHSDTDYSGDYLVSNENAYGLCSELVNDDNANVLASMFKYTDGADTVSSVASAFDAIDGDTSSFDDEYAAYLALNDYLVNGFSDSNYSEAIAIVSMFDNKIDIASMAAQRDGALENGEEGQEYNDIKDSISPEARSACRTIYQNANYRENTASKLAAVIDGALNEDSSLSR